MANLYEKACIAEDELIKANRTFDKSTDEKAKGLIYDCLLPDTVEFAVSDNFLSCPIF
jgi:hypothetical protein